MNNDEERQLLEALEQREREIAAMPAGARAIMFIEDRMRVIDSNNYSTSPQNLSGEARAYTLYTLSELLRQIERYERLAANLTEKP